MKKREKVPQTVENFTSKELTLVIKISNHMYDYLSQYDFSKEVDTSLKLLKKKPFGIQQFLLTNIFNFNPKQWYKPEELKNRFESHMAVIRNISDELLTGIQSSSPTQINSREINKALNALKTKTGFENVTGIEDIRKVAGWNIKFDGFPSVWKFPKTVNLVSGILNKPTIFKTIYIALLQSGMLYNYWRCKFLTILGCLEDVDENDINKCNQLLQNFFAAVPEEVKNEDSIRLYVQRLNVLPIAIRKLSDMDLIKNAGKMAGYIIKNNPEYSVFQIHRSF